MKSIPLVIVIIGLSAGSALAQTVYKSTMPDGRVTFGDKPARGAAKVEPIMVTLPPPTDAETAPVPQETADAKKADQVADKLEAKWKAIEKEIRDAEAALALARANAEAGVAPIPGEMIGNAGNPFVRPSQAYLARQQSLADKVTEAQNRVERAYQARNALR